METIIYLHYLESIKDPKLLIKKLTKEKEQINELVAQGEVEKAEELKKDLAWQKAFDKTAGKKVIESILMKQWISKWLSKFHI